MKNKTKYTRGRYRGDAHYGTHVTARFYNGNPIVEGLPFSADQFPYIDEMGPEWHKGHLLAKSLGGKNTSSNLLPMTQEVNESYYKAVENTVRKLIDYLPEICDLLDDEDAYVQFDVVVTDNKRKYITVAGHRFPAEIQYTIRLGRGENKPLPDISTYIYIKKLELDLSVPLSGRIRIDRR